MRLSEWRAAAPNREALAPKVVATVEEALHAMGGRPDPECWVVWGDDPEIRYTVLAPNDAGLVVCHVRVNVPGEGPRASAKLARWSRVQLGEFALETQAGHRVMSFQVEGQVLRGADAEADQIGEFAMRLFAAVDGRAIAEPSPTRRSRGTRPTTSTSRASRALAAKQETSARKPASGTQGASPDRRSAPTRKSARS